jgi:hypothetical protein
MIYRAPCLMSWLRAYPLRGEMGGGWALEFASFLGPVKWHRADRENPGRYASYIERFFTLLSRDDMFLKYVALSSGEPW